jgi:hypothetical protein
MTQISTIPLFLALLSESLCCVWKITKLHVYPFRVGWRFQGASMKKYTQYQNCHMVTSLAQMQIKAVYNVFGQGD